MKKVGICGTDLSMVYKGSKSDLKVKFPSVVGHEGSGVVTKCGKDVTNVKPGDRVAIQPGGWCRKCAMCLSDKFNLCDSGSFHNSLGALKLGCVARYIKYKGHLALKMPDSLSDEEGAMVEPLAVAVHACQRACVWAGCSVMITGAGAIGLLSLLTCKALGATNILVTDIKEGRLAMAKKMGANHTLLVTSGDVKSQAQQVRQVMGCMPDITIECSATQSGLSLGIYATKSGGKLAQVGLSGDCVSIPLGHAGVREIDIIGVYRYGNCFPIAMDLIANKLVDVMPLITHRFEFEDFQKAFDTAHTGADGAIKCMISC